jgi:hypothetical protein
LQKFSKEGKVRLPEIGAYVENKIEEKKDLKVKVEQLNIAVATLEEKKSELVKSCAVVLEQKRKAENEMKSYFDSKQEMEKLGISMNNDIPKFVGTVKSVKRYGYDPQVVVAELFDIQYYRDNLRALKIAIKECIKVHERLESQNSSLLKNIALHSEKADLYNELDYAGFGINELRSLLETVKSIAMSNQIGHWAAAGKLLNDIKTQYNAILGFESAKEELVTEISKLESERKEKLENIRNFPFIGPILAGLLSLGLNESDILKLGKIFFDIRKKSYSLKEIALIMINALEEMATNNTIATSNVEVIEILGRTREELSRLS